MELERIIYDGEVWDFSNYFEYIKKVADELPPSIRDYFTNVESYSLRGIKTLHDARITSAIIRRVYDENFSSSKTRIELRFVDQMFRGEVILSYKNVSIYEFKEFEIDKHGHADVLVHEFSIASPGVFRHRIIFDHFGEFRVEFGDFSQSWSAIAR